MSRNRQAGEVWVGWGSLFHGPAQHPFWHQRLPCQLQGGAALHSCFDIIMYQSRLPAAAAAALLTYRYVCGPCSTAQQGGAHCTAYMHMPLPPRAEGRPTSRSPSGRASAPSGPSSWSLPLLKPLLSSAAAPLVPLRPCCWAWRRCVRRRMRRCSLLRCSASSCGRAGLTVGVGQGQVQVGHVWGASGNGSGRVWRHLAACGETGRSCQGSSDQAPAPASPSHLTQNATGSACLHLPGQTPAWLPLARHPSPPSPLCRARLQPACRRQDAAGAPMLACRLHWPAAPQLRTVPCPARPTPGPRPAPETHAPPLCASA